MIADAIVQRANVAFADDLSRPPPTSLRGGNDVDSYDLPTPYDAAADEPTNAYIERHAFHALPHLDAVSWRHHLPRLIEYALARYTVPGDLEIEGVLGSLRPPDRDPPRLGSLTDEQEAVIVEFLDVLAFDDASAHQDLARQVLEEWWVPNALYRPGHAH